MALNNLNMIDHFEFGFKSHKASNKQVLRVFKEPSVKIIGFGQY